MNKPGAYILSTCVFTVLGTLSGSIASYLVTYWGGHYLMALAFLDPQTRRIATDTVLSNIGLGAVFAVLPALATAVLVTVLTHFLGKRLHALGFAAICGVVGGLLSFAIVGGNQMLGSPVTAGAIAATATGLVLFPLLRAWLNPSQGG